MANGNNIFIVPGLTASADLSAKQYHIAKVSGARTVTFAAAAGEGFGVLQNAPTSGLTADVGTVGATKVVVGAAVAAGAKLTSNAAGRAVTATAGQKYILLALEAGGADGDIITAIYESDTVAV